MKFLKVRVIEIITQRSYEMVVWNTDISAAPDNVWLIGKVNGICPYFVGKKYDMMEHALINTETGKWTQVHAWALPPEYEVL